MMRDQLDISKVDFTNADEVTGFGALVLSYANGCGLVSGSASRQSREVIRIEETARRWVNGVKRMLPALSAADALGLVDVYGFIHRIAFRRPADPAFLDNLVLSAFDARIHGDKTVDKYRLYHAVYIQVRRRNRAFMGAPLQWLCESLDRWHRNFKTGDWRKLSDYDMIRQSGILIGADMFVYQGDSADFKRALYASNRHWLDETEGMTLLELEALSRFLTSSAGFMSDEYYWKYDEAITNALITHPDTDPWRRQSLEMNLSLMYDATLP